MIYTLFCFLLLMGCSVERQPERYPLSTAADLVLTGENHPHGYRKSECFLCHIPRNLHQVDRLHLPSFGLARDLVEQEGIRCCSGCHGPNGMEP